MIQLVDKDQIKNKNINNRSEKKQRELRQQLCECRTLQEFENIERLLDPTNENTKRYIQKWKPILLFNLKYIPMTEKERYEKIPIQRIIKDNNFHYINYEMSFKELLNILYDNTHNKDYWNVSQAVEGLSWSIKTDRISTGLIVQIRKMNMEQILDLVAIIAANVRTIGEVPKFINENESRLTL